MTRVAVCGTSLAATAGALGLDLVDDAPELVLVDLGDPSAVDRAATIDPGVQRIVVPAPAQETLLRALGQVPLLVAAGTGAADLGPLVASSLPQRAATATRVVVVTGTAGGCGRTLLAVNLAARLAERGPVVLLDTTGSGAAAWWLGLEPSPWDDIEGLASELVAEHVAVVAAEIGALRVVGGRGAMPSPALVVRAARAARDLADLTIVDAPSARDERTRALLDVADRIVALATEDPASAGDAAADARDDRWWTVGSRTRSDTIRGRPAVRSLPDDPGAIRSAARDRALVGGALGRAYDELAELLAIDAGR